MTAWFWHNPFTHLGRHRLAYQLRQRFWSKRWRPWCWIVGHAVYESHGWSGGNERCSRCMSWLRQLWRPAQAKMVDGALVTTRPYWQNPDWEGNKVKL